MKKGGYRLDESFQSFWQEGAYTTWGFAENGAVRQRVWVQYGPYMKSSGDGAKKEEGNPHDDQCNQHVPSKMNDWLRATYEANCDFDMVIDVEPSLDCGNSGLGLNLRVDIATGKLEEYCSNIGPFVRRYRIEVLMGYSGDESFQGTKWVKSQMHHDGYQLGNFDSVSRDDYMNGSTDNRRSVRQRVWIQPDFRMVPIRDGDAVEEIVDESIEDTTEANVCRDTLGEHDALARDEDGEWCENHYAITKSSEKI